MDERVVQAGGVAHVAPRREAAEALAVEPGGQRAEAGDGAVQPQVKLAATDKQRSLDVPLRHKSLRRRLTRGCSATRSGACLAQPRLRLLQPADDEDSLALRPADGLEDPHAALVGSEGIQEQRAFAWKRVGWREEGQRGRLVGTARLLRRAQAALQVLRHQVLARQLHVVGVVVHVLPFAQLQRLLQDTRVVSPALRCLYNRVSDARCM